MSYGGDDVGLSEFNGNAAVLFRFHNNITALDENLEMGNLDGAFSRVENIYYAIMTKVRKKEKCKDERTNLEAAYKKVLNLLNLYGRNDVLNIPLREAIRNLQALVQDAAELRNMMNTDKSMNSGL